MEFNSTSLRSLLTFQAESYCPEELAYACTFASCLISGCMIMGHLYYYNEKHLQKCIIRILFMIPVYSVATLYAIISPEHSLIYAAIRDFYEAYVLY